MDKDIVPVLLEAIEQEFDEKTLNSPKLKKALKALQSKKATYLDVNDFAIEVGQILADVLGGQINGEILPDGKMYYNIAERILNTALKKNYELVANFAEDVQTELNHQASLRLKGQRPDLNQDRIDGMVNRISSEGIFDDVKWMLDEPIINFTQSIVDDAIKKNAEFHAKAGLSPKITRRVSGRACDWCKSLAGTYEYYDEPPEIYHRHQRCRCTVDYNPGDGRRQNVWSKEWRDPENEEKLEVRKQLFVDKELQQAKQLIRIARDSEKAVTNDLVSISNATGSKMVGLDFRLKTAESLARKIKKEPNTKMRDVLRYTNVSDSENQVTTYFKIIDELKGKGYNISEVKNYWESPNNPYNGININLLTPSKYEFELQFHTQESFDLKNGKLHELYERQRVLDPIKDGDEIIKLDSEMFDLSNVLTRPKNIERIGGNE